MALVITFTPGEQFDEEGDTITLNKLNRVINSGYGVVASGSIDEGNIGDGQVSGAKIAAIFDLTGKAVTLPVGIDLSGAIATGVAVSDFGIPVYKGQIGVMDSGKTYVSKGTTSLDDWVYGGYLTVTGDIADLAEVNVPAVLESGEPGDESSFGIPDEVGQWAIDSTGVTYRSTGMGQDDWSPIRSHTIDFKDQGSADPPDLTGYVRLYAKGNEIYAKRPDGAIEQITGFGQQVIYIRKTDPAPGNAGTPGVPYGSGAGTAGPGPEAIPSTTWTDVVFDQQAGEFPFDASNLDGEPDDGTYPWYEKFEDESSPTERCGVILSAGTYDYTYVDNLEVNCQDWQNAVSFVRGKLIGIPIATEFTEETHYLIPFSEAMNKNHFGSNVDDSSLINTPMGMEGRFAIDEPTKIVQQIFVSVHSQTWPPHPTNDRWTWAAGENMHVIQSVSGGGKGYPPHSDLDYNVYAYIKITKVL